MWATHYVKDTLTAKDFYARDPQYHRMKMKEGSLFKSTKSTKTFSMLNFLTILSGTEIKKDGNIDTADFLRRCDNAKYMLDGTSTRNQFRQRSYKVIHRIQDDSIKKLFGEW